MKLHWHTYISKYITSLCSECIYFRWHDRPSNPTKLFQKGGEDVEEQTWWWKSLHIAVEGCFYLISIGANDCFGNFTTNSTLFKSHSHEEYVEMVIGNLTNVIKVHRLGSFPNDLLQLPYFTILFNFMLPTSLALNLSGDI